MPSTFEHLGYRISRDLMDERALDDARTDLFALATNLADSPQPDLDAAWNYLRATDRKKGSLLYNAAKLLPSIHRLAVNPSLLDGLRSLGLENPALIDVNFRIDSHGEGKFLFGWHQDYWFSVCSPAAIVAWIPLTSVRRDGNGGVELIPRTATEGRILKTRRGDRYNSYADAVVIDEEIPAATPVHCDMDPGDVLFFRFDVLHRSLPVHTPDRSRWTLQLRYADFCDANFREEQYRPGLVTASKSTYAERIK